MLTLINRTGKELIKQAVINPLIKMYEEGKIKDFECRKIICQLTGAVNAFDMEWVLFRLEELKLDTDELRGNLLSLLLHCTKSREDKIIRKTFEGFRKIRWYKPYIPFSEYSRVVSQWVMYGNDGILLENVMRLSIGIDHFWDEFNLVSVMLGN